MVRSRSPHVVLPPILRVPHRSPDVAAHAHPGRWLSQPTACFTTYHQPSTRNYIIAFKGWPALVPEAVWEWT